MIINLDNTYSPFLSKYYNKKIRTFPPLDRYPRSVSFSRSGSLSYRKTLSMLRMITLYSLTCFFQLPIVCIQYFRFILTQYQVLDDLNEQFFSLDIIKNPHFVKLYAYNLHNYFNVRRILNIIIKLFKYMLSFSLIHCRHSINMVCAGG